MVHTVVCITFSRTLLCGNRHHVEIYLGYCIVFFEMSYFFRRSAGKVSGVVYYSHLVKLFAVELFERTEDNSSILKYKRYMDDRLKAEKFLSDIMEYPEIIILKGYKNLD